MHLRPAKTSARAACMSTSLASVCQHAAGQAVPYRRTSTGAPQQQLLRLVGAGTAHPSAHAARPGPSTAAGSAAADGNYVFVTFGCPVVRGRARRAPRAHQLGPAPRRRVRHRLHGRVARGRGRGGLGAACAAGAQRRADQRAHVGCVHERGACGRQRRAQQRRKVVRAQRLQGGSKVRGTRCPSGGGSLDLRPRTCTGLTGLAATSAPGRRACSLSARGPSRAPASAPSSSGTARSTRSLGRARSSQAAAQTLGASLPCCAPVNAYECVWWPGRTQAGAPARHLHTCCWLRLSRALTCAQNRHPATTRQRISSRCSAEPGARRIEARGLRTRAASRLGAAPHGLLDLRGGGIAERSQRRRQPARASQARHQRRQRVAQRLLLLRGPPGRNPGRGGALRRRGALRCCEPYGLRGSL